MTYLVAPYRSQIVTKFVIIWQYIREDKLDAFL